jgi:cytidylate kinase
MPPELSQRRPVVTISAPYGAGGSVVGPRLAARLGVPFVDRAIPVAVSRRLDVPLDEALTQEELKYDTRSRLLASLAMMVQMFSAAPSNLVNPADDESFRKTTELVLRDLAVSGAVVLGRAGAIVLRDLPAALHVRLDAPHEQRVLQAMRLGNVDRETAEGDLRDSDLAREAYVQHWYRVDPSDPRHYHLVIDSTSIDLDTCVELAARALTSRASRARPAALEPE